RIAVGMTLVTDEPAVAALPMRRPPSTGPSWRSIPTQNSVALAVNGRTSVAIHGNTRSVRWVANVPVPVEPAAPEASATVADTAVQGLGAALVNSAQLAAAHDTSVTDDSTVDSALE